MADGENLKKTKYKFLNKVVLWENIRQSLQLIKCSG